MTNGVSLSVMSVALLLLGVTVLTTAATFIVETRNLPVGRGIVVFFFCLLAIWLLASGVALVFSPTWWPNKTV